MKVLAVGGGGREHAAVEALYRSGAEIYSVMKNANPVIIARSKKHLLCSEKDLDKVCAFAKENGVELAYIGPEAPLEVGIVDALEAVGGDTTGLDEFTIIEKLEAHTGTTIPAPLAAPKTKTVRFTGSVEKSGMPKVVLDFLGSR